MSKYDDQLTDCLKYKTFLDKLTPPEHFEKMQKLVCVCVDVCVCVCVLIYVCVDVCVC